MRIIGIDPSLSSTGVCVLEHGKSPLLRSIKTKRSQSVFERQRETVGALRYVLSKGDVVVMEDFGVSAQYQPSGRLFERIELCGMIKLVAPSITGFPWFLATPSMLKSFVAGKASARKEDVVKAVKDVWKIPVGNDDEADAFGLSRYAVAAFTEETKYKTKTAKFLSYSSNVANFKRLSFLVGNDLKNINPCYSSPSK